MIRRQEVDSAATWRAILHQLPCPHPLQSWAWGEFKSRWGWRMQPTAWFEEGRPVAAALLLQRQLAGRLPMTMLYAPKGPLLNYDQPDLAHLVLHDLADIARRQRATVLKIDPDVAWAVGIEAQPEPIGAAWRALLAAQGWRYSAEQVQFPNTVTLDLTQPETELLAAMKQKTRYNIRLAAKKGVEVRPGNAADFPLIADMYRDTAARNQFAIRPSAYYLDAWRTLHAAGQAQPFLAEYDGVPIAALILVYDGPLALYMYGASREQERDRMPTYLLQWEAIRWAKAQGCASYDFWGAPDDFNESDRLWGVWRFKAGFNGQVRRHIGAWDYPPFPQLYWLYSTLLPRYTAWQHRRYQATHQFSSTPNMPQEATWPGPS